MYSGNRLEDNLKMPDDVSSQGEGWWAVTIAASAGVDPLAVAGTRKELSVYWEQPAQGLAVAGFGVAAVEQASERAAALDILSRLETDRWLRWADEGPRPPGPWFGGLAFDLSQAPSNGWTGFPLARWILPELLVWTRAGRSYVTGFASAGRAGAKEELRQRLRAVAERLPSGRHEASGEHRALSVRADPAAWGRLMEEALSAIDAGALSKVVVARSIDVEARADFDLLDVLARLRAYTPSSTTFLFRGSDGAAFVGATPETLCRVSAGAVETESLAGTSPPADPGAWLERDKERREHGAVIDAILEGLGPLCESIRVDAPTVMALPNVKHRRTPIRAVLRPGVRPSAIVGALHPTPAVGGTPRSRALAFLREHEGMERGWYAGAVGWISPEGAELRVGLRSALLHGRRARLFVGAGVVAGSRVEEEWKETEAKSALMLDALGGTP